VEITNSSSATRTLPRSREPLSPLQDAGSLNNTLPDPLARFIVEVPLSMIEGFVRLRFIAPNQGDDLVAIIDAYKRLGRTPNTSRIA
jgi:hypothetical protein